MSSSRLVIISSGLLALVASLVLEAHGTPRADSSSASASSSPRPISSSALVALAEAGKARLLDFRSQFQRETEGVIPGSELVPMPMPASEQEGERFRPLPGDTRFVVYLTSGGSEAVEAKTFLSSLGHKTSQMRCYTESMEDWKEAGGQQVEFPRFIQFEALTSLLASDRVLLIDVRNRTELNTVGQIPKSVNVPLHEVALGFDLGPEDFAERYGFAKPDADRRDIVLTCRSGRRVLVADRLLKAKGYPRLRIYSGSFKDWVARGGKYDLAQYDLDYDILA